MQCVELLDYHKQTLFVYPSQNLLVIRNYKLDEGHEKNGYLFVGQWGEHWEMARSTSWRKVA